jgi:hypothetical protein
VTVVPTSHHRGGCSSRFEEYAPTTARLTFARHVDEGELITASPLDMSHAVAGSTVTVVSDSTNSPVHKTLLVPEG